MPIHPPVLPAVWGERRYQVRVLLGGLLPLGRQWIDLSRHDAPDSGFRIRDNGSGDLARRWDHWITIAPDNAGGCTYTDDVEVDAGLLTPFVWSFARIFYAHRQRRWRALAKKGGTGARELAQRTAWRLRLDMSWPLFERHASGATYLPSGSRWSVRTSSPRSRFDLICMCTG